MDQEDKIKLRYTNESALIIKPEFMNESYQSINYTPEKWIMMHNKINF